MSEMDIKLKPPVVEFDREAGAVYVRFLPSGKVRRTVCVEGAPFFTTIDLDAGGAVIGVELIGISEFSVALEREVLIHV